MIEPGRGAEGVNRRYARRRVRLAAWLRVGGQQLSAVTEDVSPGGAFLRVDGLPDHVEDLFASIAISPTRSVHVRADVKWRRADPEGVGIQFDDAILELAELD